MENELSQSTYRELEGHLCRKGRGRKREKEGERGRERERERERGKLSACMHTEYIR